MDYENVKYINCLLCDSDEYEILANKVQFNMPYRTVICKNCGFIYLNPAPQKEELDKFYINEYEKYYGVPVSFGQVNFIERGHEIHDFLIENVKTAERIVEIGSGGGGNLFGLGQRYNSLELAAFEPGGNSKKSLKVSGINVIGEFYDVEPINLKAYDLVIMSHVLEHFHNPKDVLKKVWSETSENVNLYIAIPSLSAINRKTYTYHSKLEEYWFRAVHLSYFHKLNIEDMLALCGWEIEKLNNKENGELKILAKKKRDSKREISVRNAYKQHIEELEYYKQRSTGMKEKVILFGASQYGRMALNYLKNSYEILYFSDNDAEKWGSKIEGIDIISPHKLKTVSYDKIIITSTYYKEILAQLINMGLDNIDSMKINITGLQDLTMYKELYGEEAVLKKRFYNIGAGSFRHGAWTNVDFSSEWYAKNSIDIQWDLLENTPVSVEDNSAYIVYTSHTIEHITNENAQNLFNEAYRILQSGGIFRVTAPNIVLDYQALINNDKHYFYWRDMYSINEHVERANITQPMNETTLPQIFLYHFASQTSILHSDTNIKKISDRELETLFKELPFEDALDYCTAKCSIEIQRKYPGNHINWWSTEKLVHALKRAGFKKVYISGYGQSRSAILRDTTLFDNTHPKISLYVEAEK